MPDLKVGIKGILQDLYWAFAMKVKEYWNPHPVLYTLLVFLGIAAICAMIWGLNNPGRLPWEFPPVDATPYPEQTPCPPEHICTPTASPS